MDTDKLKKKLEKMTIINDDEIPHGEPFSLSGKFNQVNIKHCAKGIVEAVNNPPFHLLFIGATGTGKTYLARLIMRHLVDYGAYCCRKMYRDYLLLIQSNFVDKSRETQVLMRSMSRKNILLDDIGTETPATESARAFVAALIDDRHSIITYPENYVAPDLRGSTIFTTNLPVKDEEMSIRSLYGDRTLTRMYQLFTIIEFGAHCFRLDDVRIWKKDKGS